MPKKKSNVDNSQKLVYSEEYGQDVQSQNDLNNDNLNFQNQQNLQSRPVIDNNQRQNTTKRKKSKVQNSNGNVQNVAKQNYQANDNVQNYIQSNNDMQNYGQSNNMQSVSQSQQYVEQMQNENLNDNLQNQNMQYNGTYAQNQNTLNDSTNVQNANANEQNQNGQNSNTVQNEEKTKKERNWVINTGNTAILASSLSLAIDVVHKLLRMVLIASTGIIIFLYILAGILSVFALIASIKYGFKSKEITIDAYLTGISFIALILI
ncbi:MAG: hypothetical protein ACI4TX_01700 [Christensenellales bacterium]